MRSINSIVFIIVSLMTMAVSAVVTRQHYPFQIGECLSCHQQGADGAPIKNKFTAKQPDMCYKCHDRKDTKKVVHPALEMGKCTDCHSPHESKFRPLLKDTMENTCTQCHDAPGRELGLPHLALQMKSSCARCHNAHSSDQPKLLQAETTLLCVFCHTGVKKMLDNPASILHPALKMGCQSCHNPHGSNNERLLKENLNELCFTCHEGSKFETGHPRPGHPVSGRPDPLYPEKEFTCISCHKPHASVNKHLLRYNFTKKPYDGSICSVCHWMQILPPPAPPRPKWDE